MYEVSELNKAQFEKMLGLACVQEAMKFIEQDQPETMKELKDRRKTVLRSLPINSVRLGSKMFILTAAAT